MTGLKYNKLMRNKYFYKYRNSLTFASSTNELKKKKDYDYNFLHKSIIPTYHFQKSLQKLPIPKLTDTCSRYLNSLKPLIDSDEFNKTEKVTENFQNNEGAKLDKLIREIDAKVKDSNYVSEPWFDMYLSARESIVLNYNPFIAYVPHENKKLMTQSVRAANFLISSLRMFNSMRKNVLEPEIYHINPEKSNTLLFKRLMSFIPEHVSFYGAYMFNAYPLDMSQYFRLFNSTRIPKKGKDVLFTDSTKKHILVIRKGHFFSFPVIDSNGEIMNPEYIYACIDHITNMQLNDTEYPVGVLTSENRDTWAAIRERLVELGNKETLNQIDSSLYCISLDDVDTNDHDQLSHVFLHGNPLNRWFDKSFSLILTKNAHAAINFEHSWGDGVAVLRLFTEMFADVEKHQHVDSSIDLKKVNINPGNFVQELDFKIDADIIKSINDAKEKYNVSIKKLKLKNFSLDIFGKSFVKKYNLSPDSLMQTAFQAAYYKMYKQTVPTYESCSTAAFKYGRTETIRPATMNTKQFAKLFASKNTPSFELINILRDCSKLHNQLTKEAAMGQGFDRHLFVMRYYAQKEGKLPDFYLDPSYKRINHNILSTSTLAHPSIFTGGFAPVVNDGFGIGYRILDSTLGACISSYEGKDLESFVDCLTETFNQFKELLKDTQK